MQEEQEKTIIETDNKFEYFEIMIDLVNELYSRSPNELDNKTLAEYINLEFSLNITENDVNLWFSPTIQEEILDKKLTYKNLGLL